MVTKIGLDLGYANITVSDISAEVYREPAVALVDKNTRKTLCIGNDTATSAEINAILVRPFKNGLLYSSSLTKEVIQHSISAIKSQEKIRCVIALPSDFIPKQESEIFKMLNDAGVAECYCVSPAVAALVGAGYAPTTSARSVNFGASHTEIAILHNGDIISTSRAPVGGEDFDKAIKQYIYDQGGMTVSLLVARTIKERLGAVWQGREEESIDIEGILSLTGNKVKMKISSEDIVGVFEIPLQSFLSFVAFMSLTTPALDIYFPPRRRQYLAIFLILALLARLYCFLALP